MKKLITIFAAVTLLSMSAVFASSNGDSIKVPADVKSEFKNKFVSATDATWARIQGQYLASFNLNGQKACASFNEDGKWQLTSRYVPLTQLPLIIAFSLQDEYGDCKMPDQVIELTSDIETIYYIKAQNTKFTYNLKSNSLGQLTVENRARNNFPSELSITKPVADKLEVVMGK